MGMPGSALDGPASGRDGPASGLGGPASGAMEVLELQALVRAALPDRAPREVLRPTLEGLVTCCLSLASRAFSPALSLSFPADGCVTCMQVQGYLVDKKTPALRTLQ